jgi:hypothetical protein
MTRKHNEERKQRGVSREAILTVVGVIVILFTVMVMPAIGYDFHVEYLLVGTALCGIGITSGLDKR